MQFKVEYSFFLSMQVSETLFRISSVNALPVNSHPTAIAVDGRTSFKHDVNGPSHCPFLVYETFSK